MADLISILDCSDESDTYWDQQPLKTVSATEEIKTIVTSPKPLQVVLPNGFEFRNLNKKHYKEIYRLLNDHYVETTDVDTKPTRFIHKPTREFVYWYISLIPEGLAIGLSYRSKLVGMITASLFDTIFHNVCLKTPYVTLFCVQRKLRELGLGKLLMDELQQRLIVAQYPFAYFTSEIDIPHSIATSTVHSVDIRKSVLMNLGLWDDVDLPEAARTNPLHTMRETDIDSVVSGLGKSLEKYSIKPYFTPNSVRDFLLPKKDVVYTFVKRSDTNRVTDMVTVYRDTIWDVEDKRSIPSVRLGFMFYETLDINSLFVYLIYKLVPMEIDHIVYRATLDTEQIKIANVRLPVAMNHYTFNVQMIKTDANLVHGLPWGSF